MIIDLTFHAILDSGTMAGTTFDGTVSYDLTSTTGVGTEYITLTTLAFEIDRVAFTKANLNQGGQMITQDGYPTYFTGAFTPPPGSPVNDIAFGFGGPGVIGYSTPGFIGVFGAGTYHMILTPRSYLILLIRRLLRLFSK
jgi:hypothetical protein